MQATNKQSRFNIPGGGWITIEQDGDKLITQAEGKAAGLLVAQIAKREMSYNEAVSHCKYCLKSEYEILREDVLFQQLDFVAFCQVRIELLGNKNLQARNEYESLIRTAQYEIRLIERRLAEIKKSKCK